MMNPRWFPYKREKTTTPSHLTHLKFKIFHLPIHKRHVVIPGSGKDRIGFARALSLSSSDRAFDFVHPSWMVLILSTSDGPRHLPRVVWSPSQPPFLPRLHPHNNIFSPNPPSFSFSFSL